MPAIIRWTSAVLALLQVCNYVRAIYALVATPARLKDLLATSSENNGGTRCRYRVFDLFAPPRDSVLNIYGYSENMHRKLLSDAHRLQPAQRRQGKEQRLG